MTGESVSALERFVEAQDRGAIYGRALAEVVAGRKSSHWMWFVFPQLAGLGHSELSRRYSLSSLAEARAYLAHPILGGRLREISRAVLAHEGESMARIFGSVDELKLRSSMTLFARASPGDSVFIEVIDRCLGGRADELTDEILEALD
jgi:uncharacterized protein (DUF1810 family)